VFRAHLIVLNRNRTTPISSGITSVLHGVTVLPLTQIDALSTKFNHSSKKKIWPRSCAVNLCHTWQFFSNQDVSGIIRVLSTKFPLPPAPRGLLSNPIDASHCPLRVDFLLYWKVVPSVFLYHVSIKYHLVAILLYLQCSMFLIYCMLVCFQCNNMPQQFLAVLPVSRVFSCGGVWPAAAEAIFLTLIHILRPRLFYVLEQPSGSWGFKQPYMVSLIRQLQLWLGIRLCNASKYFQRLFQSHPLSNSICR